MSAPATDSSAVAAAPAPWHAEWLVQVARRQGIARPGDEWVGGEHVLSLASRAGSDLRIAEDAHRVVLFSGVLTNARELAAEATDRDAADVVLRLLRAEGESAFGRLRGPFAVLAWDRETGTLQVARDQVGLEPLFFARTGQGWLFSPSPDVLVAQPGVSSEFDRVALSEWLCGWFPAVEDTAYRDVKRVPPATVMTARGEASESRRYWDLFPESGPAAYVEERELDRFEPLLVQAVRRSMVVGEPAIFLSGGLDSIAVAATATDIARERGGLAPLALSMVFPDEASNEEVVQSGVSAQLGLEQRLVPFDEAVGKKGLLANALAMSATWPQPMWNVWSPGYMTLAQLGASAGRRLVLTGRGGDEWMTISPYWLADLVKQGNLVGAWRFLQMRRRSNNLQGLGAAAHLLWLTAGRSLASAAMDWAAPEKWHRRRRRRLLSERPEWVAPDPEIRKAMDERIDRWIEPARPPHGFYHREGRTAVRHPAVAHDLEETQEFGRRQGMRVLHPFWDVDLLELAQRVPPDLLMKDGRSKWLLRRRLAARLPGLGLERRVKISAGHVFRERMGREVPIIWQAMGGPRTLARIGVVRSSGVEFEGRPPTLSEQWGGAGRLWTLVNLETWVRQRA